MVTFAIYILHALEVVGRIDTTILEQDLRIADNGRGRSNIQLFPLKKNVPFTPAAVKVFAMSWCIASKSSKRGFNKR